MKTLTQRWEEHADSFAPGDYSPELAETILVLTKTAYFTGALETVEMVERGALGPQTVSLVKEEAETILLRLETEIDKAMDVASH